MESSEIVALVGRVVAVDVACADVECCTTVLHDLSRVVAWAESTKIAVAQRLATLAEQSPGSLFPEQVVAKATRVSHGQAIVPFKRARAMAVMPEFAAALAAGAVSVGHVDVITHAINKLAAGDRERFAARSEFLAGVAERSTVGEFARTVRLELLRTQHDDGLERLARQKRDTYLKTWVDPVTGMWCLRGEYDPETGATLANRLAKTIEKLFHDHTPDTTPTDPLDKQHHLRALALAALVTGTSTGTGAGAAAVDMSILIDYTTLLHGPHDGTVIDLGLNITLPIDTIRRMACLAEITPIIIGADGVHLHLEHDTRIANRHQRRALRAMYHGCAIHGCSVAFEHCQIHHVHWWRHHGPTNIDNLLPVCHRHHHYIHEGGWKLTLTPNRTLTITQPDGTTITHPPPQALAA